MIRQGVRICRYAVRIIPKRCPDVTGNSVRILPKYAVYKIDVIDITEKGYIVGFSETFLAKKKAYPNLLNFLNNVVDQDLNMVYQKLKNKKKFTDRIRNNSDS